MFLFRKDFKKMYAILLSCFFSGLLAGDSSHSIYPEIAKLYLPAVQARNEKECKAQKEKIARQKEAIKKLKEDLKKQYKGRGAEQYIEQCLVLAYPEKFDSMLESDAFAFAYEMLASQQKNLSCPASIENNDFLLKDRIRAAKDLSLFSGEEGDEGNNVFDKLDRTQTVWGKIKLQEDLFNQEKPQEEIVQTQKIVQTFLQKPDLMKKVDEFLIQIKTVQYNLLDAWNNTDSDFKKFQKKVYPEDKDYVLPQIIPFFGALDRKIVDSKSYLEYKSWQDRMIKPFLAYTTGGGAMLYAEAIKPVLQTLPFHGIISVPVGIALLVFCIFAVVVTVKNNSVLIDLLLPVFKALFTTLPMIVVCVGIGAMVAAFIALFYIAAIMMYGTEGKVSDCITNWIHAAMNKWSAFAQSYKGLSQAIGQDETLRALLQAPGCDQITQDYFTLLNKDSVAQKPTFWSWKSDMLWINKALMNGGKDAFIPFFEWIGRIDACLSIAKLMKESDARTTGKFCFVEFVDTAYPYFEARDVWHANLNPQKVVTNSVYLNGQDGPIGLVVSGPNAGGKTTFIKAVATGIDLSKWGVFPGSYAKMSKFKTTLTVMNTRDGAGVKSSFEAQVQNVGHVLEAVKKLDPAKKEFYLILFDESMNATNAEEGGALAYAVLQSLVSNKYGFVLSTSHLRQTTDLAQEYPQWFKNLKVAVAPNNDWATKKTKPFIYPYELKEGIADQFIAIDLAEANGTIGSEIANVARRKLVESLEKEAGNSDLLQKMKNSLAIKT